MNEAGEKNAETVSHANPEPAPIIEPAGSDDVAQALSTASPDAHEI